MLILSKRFLLFYNININLNKIFIRFLLFLIFINIILANIEREDTEPEIISDKYLEYIQNNFLGNSNENNTFIQNFGEYTISMQYLNIKLNVESINIEKKEISFFSFIQPIIEFILCFEISNNNNYTNIPNDTVSISFDKYSITPNLKFKIKNIYAKMELEYIYFERNTNHTYKYFTNEYESKKIDIYIEIDNFKYIPKIYKFMFDRKEKIQKFLYDSFFNYLNNIIWHYPEADSLYIFKLIKDKLLHNTFALNIDEDKNIEKININSFEEENYILDPQIIFINIRTDFDLTFRNNNETKKYSEIIPEIYYFMGYFDFIRDGAKIGNTTLKAIFSELFGKIKQEL